MFWRQEQRGDRALCQWTDTHFSGFPLPAGQTYACGPFKNFGNRDPGKENKIKRRVESTDFIFF